VALLVAILTLNERTLQTVRAANVQGETTATAAASATPPSLSHPLTLSLPMQRSSGGLNLKAQLRARAGDVHYQRLEQAQAHAVRLMQEERRQMHTMEDFTGTTKPVPYFGCPFADFLMPVLIGGTTFDLLFDTGSSTLAVAGASCANCVAVSPLWKSSSTSSPRNSTVAGRYGDGSGWAGEVWSESVALGDGNAALTPFTTMRIAAITRVSGNGLTAQGQVSSTAHSFFVLNPCFDAEQSERKQIFGQGILGVAFPELATGDRTGPTTDSFMMQLFEEHPELPKTFAIRMCMDRGEMWIGGVDTTAQVAPPLYTPLGAALWYIVEPLDVFIGGVPLGFDHKKWGASPSIIDSGTTLWELPTAIYRAVVKALLVDVNFQKFFRSSPTDNFFDHPSGTCDRSAVPYETLQRSLPSIALKFTNGLVLTLDGVGSYLQPCNNAYDMFTPGISPSSDNMIAGWSFLNQFVTHHDVERMQVGFSVVRGCTASGSSVRQPHSANVSLARPMENYVPYAQRPSSSTGTQGAGNGDPQQTAGTATGTCGGGRTCNHAASTSTSPILLVLIGLVAALSFQ
jgi:hypothetical protein